jgi:methyl-accepting chemotaxis protein
MFRNSLQIRFIVPVSLFVVLLVVGGALIFSDIEKRRIADEVRSEARQHVEEVIRVLRVTDALVMAQTHGAMRLLVDRGNAIGPAALGANVQLKDKNIPDLMLGGQGMANHVDLVDGIGKVTGSTATLFVKSGDEFVRLSTNVKRDNERVTGTVLDPKGKAIAAIRAGQAFYGQVDILGTPYLTGYEPIRDAQGQVIGIWYVGYKVDMAILKEVVDKSRLLHSGFLAVVDSKGKVRFHSAHVDDARVATLLENHPGWELDRQDFPAWGFAVVGAYPSQEAEHIGNQRMVAILVIGVLACLILIALLAVMLRRLVIVPLGGEPTLASAAAARIAAGDLSAPIALAAGDESSMMAAIARMQESLRTIVHSIHQGAADLTTASDELVARSGRFSDSIAQQNDATSAIAATLEEISVSIRQVSDSTVAAQTLVESAGRQASDGKATVTATVDEMRQSANSVNESARMVEKLGEDTKRISAIVTAINEIAEQTNLLALNAAIEAARAGEAGRGFAVVADEVRKLSERTAASTHKITAMIDGIQQSTATAIDGIEDGVRQVNVTVDQAVEAGAGMARIDEATHQVVAVVNDIAQALCEQSAASEAIAGNVEQVAQMNEENSAAVQEMIGDARHLQALSAELRRVAGVFRV